MEDDLKGEHHGATRTPEYKAWKAMKWRCNPKNRNNRQYYSERGIGVFDGWATSFLAFLSHIGPMPRPGMQVDRIDGNGGYVPGNVRWVTRFEQMRNVRTNRVLTIDGRALPVAQWAEISGLSITTLAFRLKRKWPISELLSPVMGKHRMGRKCAQSA